ncbi:hypothetical protein HYPSUDRAFT_1084844 [Hypholoma sublateritium FD-334 SS-4]|uniref:Uncharacterized protein n=1 Tax=Hypholoma sublateritium (strain FD-334 SS-4) TaxID=945553 RepID=A0A0D2MFD1_HYPSF|nr:hypothetical protein HYPSUDRAFT_1084844 [Hypholoma sublateritium FD-334 SS-4]
MSKMSIVGKIGSPTQNAHPVEPRSALQADGAPHAQYATGAVYHGAGTGDRAYIHCLSIARQLGMQKSVRRRGNACTRHHSDAHAQKRVEALPLPWGQYDPRHAATVRRFAAAHAQGQTPPLGQLGRARRLGEGKRRHFDAHVQKWVDARPLPLAARAVSEGESGAIPTRTCSSITTHSRGSGAIPVSVSHPRTLRRRALEEKHRRSSSLYTPRFVIEGESGAIPTRTCRSGSTPALLYVRYARSHAAAHAALARARTKKHQHASKLALRRPAVPFRRARTSVGRRARPAVGEVRRPRMLRRRACARSSTAARRRGGDAPAARLPFRDTG